jgi:DNA-binding LacI/PurR family transcriptional regulator
MTSGNERGSRRPTLDQVAEVARVSRATVSRVINDVPTVDPKIRKKVEQAIATTGYEPNLAARSLVTRRTDSVALVISEPDHHGSALDATFLNRIFTDPYFGRITAGAQEVLRPNGIHLVIIPADSAAHDQVVRYLRQGHVDGVLLVSSAPSDTLPLRLSDLNVPLVTAAQPGNGVTASYVDVHQRAGARLAAEHLLGRGCRRLATITGPLDTPVGQERLAGFREIAASAASAGTAHASTALAGTALAGTEPGDIPYVEGDFTRSGGQAAMARLLELSPELDGLFAANDLMAEGALITLQDRGRRVPDDVAVVGFDDSSSAAACRPPLTTVRQPVEEMAAEMARLLLAHIDEPDRLPRSVFFQPTLVPRRST